MPVGKKRADALAAIDPENLYSPDEALNLVKSLASAKFDETIEAAFVLGIDAKQADQTVRGTVALPHGTGKDVKVVVFAAGDEARAAEEAGADLVGGSDLVEQIESGAVPLDWDVTIAQPALMSEVGKLGKSLGPRGLMPNPKAGTVTDDIGKTVQEFKAGRVEYRNDRYGNVHIPIGKASFDAMDLRVNLAAVVDELARQKPAASKGRFIRKLSVSSTMGVGVKVDVNALEDLLELVR